MYQLDDNTIDIMSVPDTQLHSRDNGTIKTISEETARSSPAPCEQSDRLSLLKESPESVAEQLTKMCGHLFTQIQQEEFKNCNWEKKDKGSRAPCICDFQEYFNRTSAWVTISILNLDITEKQRADLITHFIKIAKKLLEFKNFHSFMAIVISLERQAISRLKRTWRRVEGKKNFDSLTEIISHTNNYEKLWNLMEKSDVPCIPYLGIFTKRFVELSAASDLSYGQKPLKIYDKLMETLAYYQRSISIYNFKENPRLQTSLEQQLRNCYLNEFERFFETELHRISLQIEPEELDNSRTLKPTLSNPLTPIGSPRRSATIPRPKQRCPLVIPAASNKIAIVSRSSTPPELRAIGLSENHSTICNPLNVSTSTLPTSFQASKKMGHRKIKSYGGAIYRGDNDPFGTLNPVINSLSIPKGGLSSLSPEDVCSLRSTNTSTESSDSGSMGNGFGEISDFTGENQSFFLNGDRQPISFVQGVKLKFKESSKLKLTRSHKYLLKLYQNEIVLSRKQSHSCPNIEKIEIPISDLPRDVCEKFQKDKRIYLNTHKIKDMKLKPRPEDFEKVLQILRQAITLSNPPESVDLIDLSHN